jgi:hypothetical protein
MSFHPGRRGSRLFWWCLWAALVLLCAAVVCPAYVNHDAAWYLHMARVMLDGGTIYRDVVDTNPPLIVFLTVPPVWLARLGVSATAAFKAYVFCAAFLSLFLSARLARRVWSGASDLSRGVFVSALVFVALPFVKADFGQREHFLILLTLPYVLAALAWTANAPLAGGAGVLSGIAGGLGFAMKPHYLLAWVAIETSLCLVRPRGRSWRRPEAIAAAAAIAGYALLIVLFVPQYLAVAESARQVYGGLNSSAALLMRLPDTRICAVALALLLLVRLPRAASSACAVLFAAVIGFLLAALLQLKGWSYHLYPARAFTVLFFVAFAIGVFEGLPAITAAVRGGVRGLAAVLVLALLVSSGRYVLEARRPVDLDLVTPLIDIVRVHAPRGPLAVLSMRTIIYPAFPAVNYTGARWSLRHNSLWFLPGLYERELQAPDAETRFRAPEAMPPLERRFYEEVVSDLCSDPPALLLIEPAQARAPAGRRALDLSAYYGQDARYQKLSRAYERLTTVGPFTVFKRTASASCK